MNLDMDITTLEKLLRKSVQSGEIAFEFSDDNIEFLLAHSDPVKLSKDLIPELERIIVDAIRQRTALHISDLQKSSTFGEYFRKLEERFIALLGFGSIADFLPDAISPEKVQYLKQDQIRRLTPKEIAEIIIHFAIPYKGALQLLKNSFRLESMKDKHLFASANARVNEAPNTEERTKTTTSSMQKLLLAVDSDKQLTNIEKEWNEFQGHLERELKSAKYI